METYKLKIKIDDGHELNPHIIHETAIGYREFVDKIAYLLTKGLKVDLSPNSSVWYPTHRIQEIFVEEIKETK